MASIAYAKQCVFCPRVTALILPKEGFEEWQEGRFIQDALPSLNVSERELLISGVCRVCQDDIFDEEL